jgi:hypothetical protein
MKINNNHKNEMLMNRLTITKVDKGKTRVIITEEEYK